VEEISEKDGDLGEAEVMEPVVEEATAEENKEETKEEEGEESKEVDEQKSPEEITSHSSRNSEVKLAAPIEEGEAGENAQK
jgi:hypothetical protein